MIAKIAGDVYIDPTTGQRIRRVTTAWVRSKDRGLNPKNPRPLFNAARKRTHPNSVTYEKVHEILKDGPLPTSRFCDLLNLSKNDLPDLIRRRLVRMEKRHNIESLIYMIGANP